MGSNGVKSILDFKIQEFRDGIPAGRIPGTVYITPRKGVKSIFDF
jgi:hypothetical protein